MNRRHKPAEAGGARGIGGRVAAAALLVAVPALAEAPEGFQPFLGMKDQFELALPSGWSAFDQAAILTGKPGKTGPPVVFSSEPIDGQAMMSGDEQALQKVVGQLSSVEVGALAGFTLDRLPAKIISTLRLAVTPTLGK